MEKVIILLSTYNGGQYVGEQIDSILNQSYQNIDILVRDDGSSDRTMDILEKYEKRKAIKLIRGENKGFINSFFDLIRYCHEGDYYAFCDQDDIWKNDKIEQAVKLLAHTSSMKPCLYFSDYDYYDQDMNFVERCVSHKKGPSFTNALVDCIPLGISSVFNHTCCQMMKDHVPNHACGHDWWTYMLCAGLGEVIYDQSSTVKYRRHNTNVSPGGKSFIAFQIWRIKKFLINDYFKNVRAQLKEFSDLYSKSLSPKDQETLALFVNKRHFHNYIGKIFYVHAFRQGISDEIMLRMIFMLGKL